jgi:nucleoside-diphosphate-sugar epimerase
MEDKQLRVLVTGGTGFIGGHVLRGLRKKGADAVAFDAVPSTEWISDIVGEIGIVRGEVQDLPSIIAAIKKFEITHIVHTASLLTMAAFERPLTAFNVNILGTANILEAARLMDISQVTYTSSTAVYGFTERGKVIDEEHPQKPASLYGVAKLLGEQYGSVYNQDYGVGFNALRFPIVYGPGQSRRGISSIKEVVEKAVRGMQSKVPVGGDQEYDTVYVKDVADGIISACFARKTPHRIFNIGLGVTHTLRDVAKIVATLVAGANFDIGPGEDPAEPTRGPLNIERARTELGYTPKFDLDKGVSDYVRTLQYHEWGND